MLGYLAARAIPGIESASREHYSRAVRLPHGSGILVLRLVPGASWVDCSLALSDLRDVTAAVQRARRLLDLDADPDAIAGSFAGDPLIGPLAARCPGRRAVGAVDGNELAIRAVLGQQVSLAAARGLGARLAALCGSPLPASAGPPGEGSHGVRTDGLTGEPGKLTRVFPDAAAVAGLDPAALPVPGARARTVVTLAAALASGDITLDPGADRDETTARLLAHPGIGPWTAGYIRMRALSDPDVFLPGDAALTRSLTRLAGPAAGRDTSSGGGAWRPWRSYAVHHLWAVLEPRNGLEPRNELEAGPARDPETGDRHELSQSGR
jgi:AraC family transcriptional regulator of adaptative response / DNA-3-methyladenine glycosylase II